MVFIKTCYGTWVNPAQVKHFNVRYSYKSGKDYVIVTADDITLAYFDIEPVPDTVSEQSRQAVLNRNKGRARAEALMWLDGIIQRLEGGNCYGIHENQG